MEIMIVGGILLFIIICFILNIKFFINNRRTKKKIREENIVSYDKKSQKIINEKEIELSNILTDLEEQYKKTINDLKEQTSEQRQELERSIETNKEILRHQEEEKEIYLKQGQELIQKELNQYKTEELAKINLMTQEQKYNLGQEFMELRRKTYAKLTQIEEETNIQKDKAQAELKLIEAELEEYRSKRAAINEAIRRERAIEEEADFYRIIIPEYDREDISVLSNISPKLRNKEILNKLIYETFIKRPLQEMTKRVVSGKKSGIYKITYIKTGESYIGKSSDIANRWTQHCKSSLNIGTIAHSTFHNILSEKGIWNFTWEILEEVPKEELTEREKYWIEFYGTQTQFNQKIG